MSPHAYPGTAHSIERAGWRPGWRPGRPKLLLAAILGLVFVNLPMGAFGCGPTGEARGIATSEAVSPDSGTSTSTRSAAQASPSTTALPSGSPPPDTPFSSSLTLTSIPPGDDVAHTFGELARITAPMPIYGLAELPPGWHIAPAWWPLLSMARPSDYQGPPVSNPRVEGEEAGRQAVQVVLAGDDQWMVILENFRGDLGDVAGHSIGDLGGHNAMLYALNNGMLIQWSDAGRWYGIFARGVRSGELIRIALGMRLIAPRY